MRESPFANLLITFLTPFEERCVSSSARRTTRTYYSQQDANRCSKDEESEEEEKNKNDTFFFLVSFFLKVRHVVDISKKASLEAHSKLLARYKETKTHFLPTKKSSYLLSSSQKCFHLLPLEFKRRSGQRRN